MSADTGYYCLDCGAQFDVPISIIERHGLDSPPYETFNACPVCRSTDYVMVVLCDCCGKIIQTDYVHTDDGCNYCEDCYHYKEIE